jgi:serine protease Do
MSLSANNNQWSRKLLAILAMLIAVPVAIAQEPKQADPLDQARDAFRNAMQRVMIPTSSLSDGPQVRSAFRDTVDEAAEATVSVRVGGKQVALGGIVGTDGWVITKADELQGPVSCKLKDGREFDARVVGVDKAYDMAMLKMEAKELPVLSLKREDDATVGEWVATVAPARDPVAVGIVAVDTRKIRPQRGWLGIQLDMNVNEPRVALVYEGSAAENCGLQVNDVIVEINEEEVKTREGLFRLLGKYTAGDVIGLEVERDGERLTLQGVLTPQVAGMPNDRSEMQNNLGSELSKRRFGFDAAFQHDTVLRPNDCGGPLVDLEGRVVGFNIARSGRTESYAIPANVAITRFYDLMSGNLAPAEVPEDQPKPEPQPEAQEVHQEAVE